jgi:hypothetical protein
MRIFTCLVLGLSVLCPAAPGAAQETPQASKDGALGAIVKLLTGDVYAEPSRWRELSWGTFFTEGWDEAWVSPPPGGGGAPRQGWLNTFDGVFYRLGIATYVIANFAAGYYFTAHDLTPFGDLVWYLSTNLAQAIDGRGPDTTTVTLTPGFRTHLGRNWYLLGAVEVPVTGPRPFDYQVLAGLMKVF